MYMYMYRSRHVFGVTLALFPVPTLLLAESTYNLIAAKILM